MEFVLCADNLQNFNPDIKEKASIYVPAIGKVTIVVLLRNLLRLMQNRPQTNGANGSSTRDRSTTGIATPEVRVDRND